MSVTPLMEQMAIAVLRGDEVAALALSDALNEVRSGMGVHIPPIKQLGTHVTVHANRIRVVLKVDQKALDGGYEVDVEQTRLSVRDWLLNGETLILQGMTLEGLYEIPSIYGHEVVDASSSDDIPSEQILPDTTQFQMEQEPPTQEIADECTLILRTMYKSKRQVQYLQRYGPRFGFSCCQFRKQGLSCNCLEVARP